VIEQENHDRIAEALAGRRDQQPFVDELSESWKALTHAFEDLVQALEGAEHSLRDSPPDENGPDLRGAVATALHGRTDDGQPQVGRQRARLEAASRQVDAVYARVHRDTVNIGVIGGTKVGKSTLLRTITDLPDTVIPTTKFNPTTAAASRIYHATGQPTATLLLHTWESFRDTYLAPLHESAGLGPPCGCQ
jgi:hypothetical protein